MLSQATVSVTTAAVRLLASSTSGQLVAVTNLGSSILYIGDWDVTAASGFEVNGGETYTIDLQPGESLYAIRASGTANALLIYSTPVIASGVVPKRITIGLGASLPASPATVVTSSAGLPAAPVDGQLAMLRVGTWPDVEYVFLVWDATNAHWISKAQSLISMTDTTYMGTNTTTYSYISTDNSGTLTGGLGWATRPIRHASDIAAAGFKLQVSSSALMINSSVAIFTVMPRFYQHNDGDTVTSAADGSDAVAECLTALVSAGASPVLRATGWQSVVKIGTVTPVTGADIVKKNLWPRLYGKVASGATYGAVIDLDLQYRWIF